MDIEQVQPLVIRRESGEILDVSLMNEKSFTKSRERGELWHLNRDTGRVLPYREEGSLRELKSQPTWYEAVIESPSSQAPGRPPAAREPSSEPAGTETRPTAGQAQPAPGVQSERTAGRSAEGADTAVLTRLEHTIRRRREELPEGSYTTHLFTSGQEKIRKKTGEEAVELILARDPAEIAAEASDLIYHLLVLLAALDIPLEAVLHELSSREERPPT
jgi:phosphoribosyl-ATP pyrophosphohydrolase